MRPQRVAGFGGWAKAAAQPLRPGEVQAEVVVEADAEQAPATANRAGNREDEGDEIAGFRVLHFPGHAPGLIGLWRESDRVALVSDVVYLVDSARLKPLPEGEASVPHPAWAWDHAKAKESLRRLAALEPAVVCTGHDGPLRGENLRVTLERAAEKY